jgi:hypothetical protein
MDTIHQNQGKSLPWNEVEQQIKKEINWLEGAISIFREEERNAPIQCKRCLLRAIAILTDTQ